MFIVLIIVTCLLLNAILSCVEMAFVTVSKPHLRKLSKQGDKQAAKVLSLRSNPERVLSVLQIGITLVGAISAAVGGAGAEESLSPLIQNYFQISEKSAETISIIVVVIPLTYFSVVIGELVPKTLALRFPMKYAKLGGYFLGFMDRFFSPIVYLLELSTKLIVLPFIKRMGSESFSEQSSSIDIDDMIETNKQYVFNLMSVDKRKIKDILVPWSEVTCIKSTNDYIHVLDLIRSTRYTRFPVIDQNMKPIGILHAKDFNSEAEISRISWLELIRPTLFINADEPIMSALKSIQNKKSHIAIVVNKQNSILGIVTLEDVFEEIVGDIYDDDDNPQYLLSSNTKIRNMILTKK